MSSSTEISNMALSHLAISREIAALDTERSQEAQACRRFYETVRKTVLRDYPWPFATKFATLALVEDDPNSEWDFSYRYPSDCLNARRILSGTRNDTKQTLVPYKLGNDDSGKLIYTDQADAEIEYTIDVSNNGLFTSDFELAFSLRLAAYIAPRLTGGDPFKLGEKAMKLYFLEIANTSATAANEEQDEEEPESELIRARN